MNIMEQVMNERQKIIDFFRITKKNLLNISFFFIIGASLGLLYKTFVVPNVYESTSSIQVRKYLSNNQLNIIESAFTNASVLDNVATKLNAEGYNKVNNGHPISSEYLAAGIVTTLNHDSEIIYITYFNYDKSVSKIFLTSIIDETVSYANTYYSYTEELVGYYNRPSEVYLASIPGVNLMGIGAFILGFTGTALLVFFDYKNGKYNLVSEILILGFETYILTKKKSKKDNTERKSTIAKINNIIENNDDKSIGFVTFNNTNEFDESLLDLAKSFSENGKNTLIVDLETRDNALILINDDYESKYLGAVSNYINWAINKSEIYNNISYINYSNYCRRLGIYGSRKFYSKLVETISNYDKVIYRIPITHIYTPGVKLFSKMDHVLVNLFLYKTYKKDGSFYINMLKEFKSDQVSILVHKQKYDFIKV